MGIWSDSPLRRLQSVRCHQKAANRISRELSRNTPSGHWPFGMPTSINPWILVMGISPGHGTHENNDSFYPLPTVGHVHTGFGGEFADPCKPTWDGPYWQKTRKLCIGMIQKFEPKIKLPMDCLSLSGHLNLGTKQQGRGTFDATDPKIIKWIPTALETLKPRVVILFGWKSLMGKLKNHWDSSHPIGILVNSDPEKKIPFKCDSKRMYCYSIWRLKSSWGKITAICWPNHPIRPPFGGMKNWEKSVKQASPLLKQ